MEKISLLLLVAKKTLIGAAVAGILGAGGLTHFFNSGNHDKSSKKIEKTAGLGTSRTRVPGGQ